MNFRSGMPVPFNRLNGRALSQAANGNAQARVAALKVRKFRTLRSGQTRAQAT